MFLNLKIYIKKVMLPKELKPKSLFNLIRLGKDNDGGYLICKHSLEEASCLVSFGIDDDFSFEEDFKDKNNIEVLAFDRSVNNRFFLKKTFFSLLKLNITHFYKNLINHLKFKKFFDGKKNFFFRKRIGKGGTITAPYISIEEIIKLTKKNSQIFFKIDIEGSEYRILDDLVKNSKMISGIAIEFHTCDINMERIIKFIKNIDLTLVHIHANNWGGYGINDIPVSLELSFSRKPLLISNELYFPHQLDQKNNEKINDIKLKFSNY